MAIKNGENSLVLMRKLCYYTKYIYKQGEDMLDTRLFDYKEERKEAMACHNIALWYKLFKEEEEVKARQEYYFNKFLEDDMLRCTKGF